MGREDQLSRWDEKISEMIKVGDISGVRYLGVDDKTRVRSLREHKNVW